MRYRFSQDILRIATGCAVKVGLPPDAVEDCAAAFLEQVLHDDSEEKLRPPEMRDMTGLYHGPWVAEVALNHARNFRKHLLRREPQGQEWVEAQADAAPSVESLLLKQSAREAILGGMAQLKEAPRELILLYYFEGLSILEISEATGRSPHAVEQALLRVRRSLRAHLERHGWTWDELSLHLSSGPGRGE